MPANDSPSALRLTALTALTMVAFAANSVLNRLALAADRIDPFAFANIRVASGAAILVLLVLWRDRRISLGGPLRLTGTLSLTLYLVGFSAAYVALDAGAGALILFGTVQLTMFAYAVARQEPLPPLSWAGTALALGGLAWLLWPAGDRPLSPIHAALMLAAGLGWGIYSLAGRSAGEPLRATAANFVLATPLCLAIPLFLPAQTDATPTSAAGVALAVMSGAVTSGLGYALWYSVLPRLAASVAAVAQLTVPVIAVVGGMVFLGEALTLRLVLASALVLGGVALFIAARHRRSGSSGS